MNAFLVVLRRELSLTLGRGGGPLSALAFYAGLTGLLPLASGSGLLEAAGDQAKVTAIALAVSWLALALSTLIALERLFERDFEDGGLDLLALGPVPLEGVAFAKAFGQWLSTGLPLAFAAPLAAIILHAPVATAPLVLACALVGGLAFAFLGGIGAALALGSRRGGLLIAVVVLPLFVPPVLFGGVALSALADGENWKGGFLLLCAYTAAAVALSPLAMAAACRNAQS
ncbi:MAG: heme transporter [Caulobacteraceae bacterium]|nr:heme transporter [Caulobacteraceae bacterium]